VRIRTGQRGIAGRGEVVYPVEGMDLGAQGEGDGYGVVGGAGIEQDDLVDQARCALQATGNAVGFVAGDDDQGQCARMAADGPCSLRIGFCGFCRLAATDVLDLVAEGDGIDRRGQDRHSCLHQRCRLFFSGKDIPDEGGLAVILMRRQ
jgi:hypothetical protein